MARRKRYIKGRIYITTDKLLVGGKGKKRRVVSMGNDKNNMAVRVYRHYMTRMAIKRNILFP